MNEECPIICKTELNAIATMLQEQPEAWPDFLTTARTITRQLSATNIMHKENQRELQTEILSTLQSLAIKGMENGETSDIMAWCLRYWLILLQYNQSDVVALHSIGRIWLARAQPALAKIKQDDHGSSLSTDPTQSQNRPGSSRDTTMIDNIEQSVGTPQYVEARGYLQPAIESLEKAITAATSQHQPTGALLAVTADACISMGNVSSPRPGQQYFRRAIELLRAATSLDDPNLDRHLREFLDYYGRYVD